MEAEAQAGTGSPFDGTFRLLDEIGRGSHGVVYHALQQPLEEPVAIKVLHERVAEDAPGREQFNDEVRAFASLDHPNLVSISSYGVAGEAPYIVMELLEGETVAARLGRGPIAPAEAETLIQSMLRAVAHLHLRGLVHRNLSPGALFLQRRDHGEQLKLIDYGLSRFAQNTDTERIAVGPGASPYLSPEQAAGDDTDARTDVYAAGAIMLRLFGADPPPRAANDGASMHPVSGRLHAGASPQLDALVARALAPHRQERFGNADQMLKALLELPSPWVRERLDEETAANEVVPVASSAPPPHAETEAMDATAEAPASSRHNTPPPSPAPPRQRGAALKLIAAGALGALLAGGGTAFWLARQDGAYAATDAAKAGKGEEKAPQKAPAAADKKAAATGETDKGGPHTKKPQAAEPLVKVEDHTAEEEDNEAKAVAETHEARGDKAEADMHRARGDGAEPDTHQPRGEKAEPDTHQQPRGDKAEPDTHQPRGERAEPDTHQPRGEKAEADMHDPRGDKAGPDMHDAHDDKAEPDTHQPRGAKAEADMHDARGDKAGSDTHQPRGDKAGSDTHQPHGDKAGPDTHQPRGDKNEPDTHQPRGDKNEPDTHQPRGAKAETDKHEAHQAADSARPEPLGAPGPTREQAAHGEAPAHPPGSSAAAHGGEPSAAREAAKPNPPQAAPGDKHTAAEQAAPKAGAEHAPAEESARAEQPAEPEKPAEPPPPRAPPLGAVRHVKPIAAEIRALLELAQQPKKARAKPKDPWDGELPSALESLRGAIANGERGSSHQIAALRHYNGANPGDVHGHLLLAGLYKNRGWSADALDEYDMAYRIDSSVRGAREMLEHALGMVARDEAGDDATRFIQRAYQREALPGIDRALREPGLDARAVARLKKLRARVQSGR